MNGYLLDTNILVWALEDDQRLGQKIRGILAAQSGLYVSAATIWEIAIKRGLGKLRLAEDPLVVVQRAG